jgi:hypothetical protein
MPKDWNKSEIEICDYLELNKTLKSRVYFKKENDT